VEVWLKKILMTDYASVYCTDDGQCYKGLHCYNNACTVTWKYSFQIDAIGMSPGIK
jgi:hypothetical protein